MTQAQASKSYSIRLGLFLGLYAVGLCAAVWAHAQGRLAPPLDWIAAVALSLPIGGICWALMRFVRDSDEWHRALLVKRMALATMLVMFLATVAGFLERFADVPAPEMFLVFPAWCFALAFANLLVKDSK